MSKLNILYNVWVAHNDMVKTRMDMESWSKNKPDYHNITIRVAVMRRDMENNA